MYKAEILARPSKWIIQVILAGFQFTGGDKDQTI